MKKIEKMTPNGVIEYYQDDEGNITTAKPIEGIKFQRWIVTNDPSQYTAGKVLHSEAEALVEQVRARDGEELFVIELSYIDDDLPPQYIHVITSDGKKVRIL